MHYDFLEKFDFGDNLSKSHMENLLSVVQNHNLQKPCILPHLFISAPDGAGTTTLGKAISQELEKNHYFKIHGQTTFLELSLPKPESQSDASMLDKFFASPRIAAGTQNKFYGLFLVDLSAWRGKDLMISTVIEKLMNFVKENRNNIYFCFRVKPDFEEKEKLIRELKKYLSVRTIELKSLNYSQVEQFICDCMETDGLILPMDSKEELHKLLQETYLLNREDSLGYYSIELFVKELEYQLLTELKETSEEEKEKKQRVISKNQIQKVMMELFPRQETRTNRKGFGFC